MKVKEVMEKDIPTLHKKDKLEKAVHTLIKIPYSALPVLDSKKKVVGEISQHRLLLMDVGQVEAEEGEGIGYQKLFDVLATEAKYVEDLMNTHEFTVLPDHHVMDAARIMYDQDIKTIPIINKRNQFQGVITDISILKYYKKLIGRDK